jgi:hypothetical protein
MADGPKLIGDGHVFVQPVAYRESRSESPLAGVSRVMPPEAGEWEMTGL